MSHFEHDSKKEDVVANVNTEGSTSNIGESNVTLEGDILNT